MADHRSERMVALVEKLLTVLIWLNLAFAALFVFFLVLSFALADQIHARNIAISANDLNATRIAFVIGIFIVPLAHIALERLRAIVRTVRGGDPFVPANARRLTAIAWALLGIMILDLAFGIMAAALHTQFGWSFSLTGWLAILLLFVLARVFDHGTRLRDDVEGTV